MKVSSTSTALVALLVLGPGCGRGLDVSVPRSSLPALLQGARALVAAEYPFVRVCDFGHWGDGGVHVNNQLFYDRYTPEAVKALCRGLKAQLDPRGLLGTTLLG